METLSDYLKRNRPQGFNPVPYYSTVGDSLVYLFRDERYYGERIDDFLTVYRSQSSDELVGCQIKGVAHAFKLFGNFGVNISADRVRLSVLFALLPTVTNSAEQFYFELSKAARASDATIPNIEPALA